MFRYVIFVYTVEDNKIASKRYEARHFEVNNISLHIFTIDYDEIWIHLDSSMRFEVIPYIYFIEIK